MTRERRRLRLSAEFVADCVDEGTFLSIMSAFPTGVTVVTTLDAQGRPCGLTCSAACSLSKSPPMLLVCIHNASRVLRAILHCDRFIVNFLRDNRESISSLFASQECDRFSSVSWRPSRLGGLPWLLNDTIAYSECRLASAVQAGDHTVLISAILDGQVLGDTVGPLMYWRRSYGRWPTEEDAITMALSLAAEG